MSPIDYALSPLRRYAQFSGRARRSEYWWYTLGLVIASVVTSIVDNLFGWSGLVGGVYGPLTGLLILGTFIPSLAASVRRLHDTNRSGFWLLLFMVPYVVMAVMAGMAMAQGNAAGALASVGLLGILVILLGVVILVFLVLDGTRGDNRFGPDPKAAERTGAYQA